MKVLKALVRGGRGYAGVTTRAGLRVFDEGAKWAQRERAAADALASRRVDYLRDELAARLCDRLLVSFDDYLRVLAAPPPPPKTKGSKERGKRFLIYTGFALGYRSLFPDGAGPRR